MNRTLKPRYLLPGVLGLAFALAPLHAQAPPAPATPPSQAPAPDAQAAPATQDDISDLESQIKALRAQIGNTQPGSNKFLLTGYADMEYSAPEGQNRTFSAAFNPIFLWKINDKIFLQAETEIGIDPNTGQTSLNLEYANIAYFLNDNATILAGRFLTPLSTFVERYHPAWINRSLTKAMYADDMTGFVPMSSLGTQVRGAFALGTARLKYAVWTEEGPALVTDPASGAAGTLQFDGVSSAQKNNNLSVGGHLWYQPIPGLEVGYGRMTGRPGPSGAGYDPVHFTLQEGDFSGRLESDHLAGVLELRGEWVQSRVDAADYGTLAPFDNLRAGGFGQVSYRPSGVNNAFFQKLETVARYDWTNQPEGNPWSQFSQRRWTLNFNYWLTSNAVVKVGMDRTRSEDPSLAQPVSNGVTAAFALGF